MRATWGTLWTLTLLGTACPPPPAVTPEDAAHFFGLEPGRSLVYAVTGGPIPTTAHIDLVRNDSFADYLGFSATERNAGNIIQEVLLYGAEAENLRLTRVGDCLPNCTTYANPPILLKVTGDDPETLELVENTTYTTETATQVTTSGGTAEGPRERHEITVSARVNTVTPAGTFSAYPVAWRKFVVGQSGSEDRLLYFAPQRGFIRLDRGSLRYEVQGGVSP
ncbi:MAG: hypothetical protein HY904_23325 [Deltaproteobacteria bacterium]|nr:hypothetical protein [Deltaproteobacteria bacterium]